MTTNGQLAPSHHSRPGTQPVHAAEAPHTRPVLCVPAVEVPEHVITIEESLDLAARLHHGHEDIQLALRLIKNTGVRKRHLVQTIEATLDHPGLEERNLVYVREAKRRVPPAVTAALANAGVCAREIDAIIFVSCTGFTMPALTAWMINTMGFRTDTRQMPIAQMGCAGGASAINRAHDFCLAHPGANALIVACEFCSLCYQPDDLTVGNLLSNGLFGDAVAAAVVRGDGHGRGMRLESNATRLIPDTEEWISYALKPTGFHFLLDRRVPHTMQDLAPALVQVSAEHGWDATELDFYVIHAGGPRILDDLSRHLNVKPAIFERSRDTLTDYGNIASAVVLDTLRRTAETGLIPEGAHGLLAGFGPGITAEIALGTWTNG
ncbi:type III polyketide synthase (plasmid) [Streptomyces sp. NBC_01426]|uniref:type III polyketide synthase n=1 Tax=Streptomyces sp. NBC_01426 TaxID=2975866 RepID=UPI002E34142C|nr:type III polyketide synthase [Streptomyces sp. NBC_01426]